MLVTFSFGNIKMLVRRSNRNQKLFSLNSESKYVNNGLLRFDMHIDLITKPEHKNTVCANLRYNFLHAFIIVVNEGYHAVNNDI